MPHPGVRYHPSRAGACTSCCTPATGIRPLPSPSAAQNRGSCHPQRKRRLLHVHFSANNVLYITAYAGRHRRCSAYACPCPSAPSATSAPTCTVHATPGGNAAGSSYVPSSDSTPVSNARAPPDTPYPEHVCAATTANATSAILPTPTSCCASVNPPAVPAAAGAPADAWPAPDANASPIRIACASTGASHSTASCPRVRPNSKGEVSVFA